MRVTFLLSDVGYCRIKRAAMTGSLLYLYSTITTIHDMITEPLFEQELRNSLSFHLINTALEMLELTYTLQAGSSGSKKASPFR